MNTTFKGLIFLVIGVSILLYVFYKRKKNKDINDFRGFIAGIGSTAFGIYLIYESIKE